MKYRKRPGVVHTVICNTHVLIPNRAAAEHCRTMLRMPLLWAYTWDQFDQPEAQEKLMHVHRVLTKADDATIRKSMDSFFASMAEHGYLIPEEEDS